MTTKKQHPTLILILSIFSFVAGAIFMMMPFVVTASDGNTNSMGMAVGIIIGMVFLILGICGFSKFGKIKNAEGKKSFVAVYVIIALVLVIGIFYAVKATNFFSKTMRMTAALESYVRDTYSQEKGELPDDPHFVFYENDQFYVPDKKFILGTDDPSKVNVVVKIEEYVNKNGIWVNEATGEKVSDAHVQVVKLYVIRLKDWALIDEFSDSVRLRQDENGINVLGMNSVIQYLNNLGK